MKLKIECVCGSEIYTSRYEAHLKTKKHTAYITAVVFNTFSPKVIEKPAKDPSEDECVICSETGICSEGFFTCAKCKQKCCLDCQDQCDKCPFCRTADAFSACAPCAPMIIEDDEWDNVQ